jgi:hypothetical protein
MKKYSIWLLFLAGILLLTSCNLPSAGTSTAVGPDSLRTVAAMTLDALSTRLAQPSTANPGGTTPIPGNSTATLPPQATPSTTPLPSQTVTPGVACDQAAFIRDATIPDNTILLPGTAFTKTWEIKNSGSCNWDSTFSLVFGNQGDLMGGPLTTPVVTSGTVAAGQTVQVSVNLVAPQNTGSFKGYWKLQDPTGNVFFGANQSIWVAIKVVSFDQHFVLIDDLCSAQWRTTTDANGNLLACPGKEGDSKGYVLRTDSPIFYTRGDNEPTIILGPQKTDNGMIVGTFPPLLIPANTRFRTFAGCGANMDTCDATVILTAQVGDASEQTLKEWEQKAADFNQIVVDLDAAGLTGKSVVFRIYVRAKGAADQDKILFLSPLIEQKP